MLHTEEEIAKAIAGLPKSPKKEIDYKREYESTIAHENIVFLDRIFHR